MNRHEAFMPSGAEQFRMSRSAVGDVIAAQVAGIPKNNISSFVEEAVRHAKNEGRTKVGRFGGAERVLMEMHVSTQEAAKRTA